MSLAVTQNGNFYNKSNVGKTLLGTAGTIGGAMGGLTVAEKILRSAEEEIKSAPQDILETATKIIKEGKPVDTLKDKTKDVCNALKTKSWLKNYKNLGKVALGGAAAACLIGIGVGAIADVVINKVKAHNTDKRMEEKTETKTQE